MSLVHLCALSLLPLFLCLLGVLQLGLGDFAAGLGGADSAGAGGVHQGSFQDTRPVLLPRGQVTLPPLLEIILTLASKLFLPVAGDLAALRLDGLLAVIAGPCSFAGPWTAVAFVGDTHTPLPVSAVRLALLLSLFLGFASLGCRRRGQDQDGHHHGDIRPLLLMHL